MVDPEKRGFFRWRKTCFLVRRKSAKTIFIFLHSLAVLCRFQWNVFVIDCKYVLEARICKKFSSKWYIFSEILITVKYEISVYLALQAIPCLECITSCYTSLYDVQRITEMQDVKTLEKPRLATTQVSPFWLIVSLISRKSLLSRLHRC